ncbi:MAG: hypothetical protein OS112_01180 [Methanoregula sp.]|nr:MAG: hypothetical protein OS112_01180 [Methanoregula sp.]
MPALFVKEELEKNKIFLVLTSPAKIRERNIEIIRDVSSMGYHTLVITTNFPYSVLAKLYKEHGIDPAQVSFVDAVTRSSLGNVENIPGAVRYVNNPANLTDLGIAVTEMLKELSTRNVCILFDSVSTMLIYLSSPNISKFIHFVTNKLRLLNISGIFLAAEKGLDPQLLSQLTTFVDNILDTG